MRYVLDTTILLHYVRKSEVREFIEDKYAPFNDGNKSILSIKSTS